MAGFDETPPPSWQEIAEALTVRLAEVEAARDHWHDRWQLVVGERDKALRAGFAEAIALLRAEPNPAPWQQKPQPTSYMRRSCADFLEANGHCHIYECRLHYAHKGPCDIRRLTGPAGSAHGAPDWREE